MYLQKVYSHAGSSQARRCFELNVNMNANMLMWPKRCTTPNARKLDIFRGPDPGILRQHNSQSSRRYYGKCSIGTKKGSMFNTQTYQRAVSRHLWQSQQKWNTIKFTKAAFVAGLLYWLHWTVQGLLSLCLPHLTVEESFASIWQSINKQTKKPNYWLFHILYATIRFIS